jgi:3'(2'), 5'-bisphosphate nucleotidase
MCAVAAGEADLYPRLNPTCYWDTAAGTAVARAAGCRVEDPSGRPLRYDRARGIKHHGFIVRHPAITVPSETREKH